MARPVLDAMDMDTLTKGRYVQLLARGYPPKDVFKSLSKGTDMEKERLAQNKQSERQIVVRFKAAMKPSIRQQLILLKNRRWLKTIK